MTRLTKGFLIFSVIISLFGLIATSSFAFHTPKVKTSEILHIPFFIEDVNGDPPAGSDTPLYENRLHNPILTPDGHHVTLDEFNAVTGKASAKCWGDGTTVRVSLKGLIPNGVYTVWNVTFNAPGFEPTFAHLAGVGALGPNDGSENTFTASPWGTGHLWTTTPPGALSMLGSIGDCALTDEFEWHLVGAYHLDNQSHGPDLGPDGTAVEQFGFVLNGP